MFFLLITLCVLLVIWKLSVRNVSSSEPPMLSGNLPFIGHALRVLGDSVKMYDGVKGISEDAIKNGGVASFFLGPIKFYGVSDPDDCLTASSCIKKHYIYDFARPIFANGILNADVATWKKHRRLLNPAFSQQVLNGFIDVFNAQAVSLVKQFGNEVGQPFDHEHYLRINNLETICSTATGVDPDEYGDLQKNYLPCLEEILQIINQRIQKFWYHNDFIFNISPLKKKLDEVAKHMVQLSDSIIQKKKIEMKSPDIDAKPGKLKPFIDLILELAEDNSSFTDEQIRGETSTIIAGGHDTSASALTFALTLLGSHPEVQEKAYEEIVQVLGNSFESVDKEELSKLVYIEAILKETLRLYPSVPIIARLLDSDIKLKNFTMKVNTGCIISIYGTHRHPIWGPNANDFVPDRWFDKDTLPDPKYYAAFGVGRRNCIGKTYAIMSMKIILAHVLRKYRISSDISKMVVKMDTMIRPVSGYHITLEQRNK